MSNGTPNTTLPSLNSTSNGSSSNGLFAFGVFVEVIFLWTMIGNLIIISILKLYKPLTIPDILVFSLALSDFLNVLIPAHMLNFIQSKLIDATWNESLCIAFTWSVHCLRLSSVLTVSVIAIDRLVAIRKPLFYRSRVMHEIGRVKIVILLLWIFSCLTAAVPYMKMQHSPFKNNECHYQLHDLGPFYGFFVEILGLLQLALVLYCYIAIRISTWHFMKRQGNFRRAQLERMVSNPINGLPRHEKKATAKSLKSQRNISQTDLTGSTADDAAQTDDTKSMKFSFIKRLGSKKRDTNSLLLTEGMKQVAKMEKMMAVLVFLFYVSWLPFLGSNLISLITGKSDQGVTRVIGVFSLINGFLNPIVYATIYPRYKKGYVFVFQTIFRICRGKKPTLTTADFDSSKIGRSRRLQTLKEMKSNASVASNITLREVEAPQIRYGWTKDDVIPEEKLAEKQEMKSEECERKPRDLHIGNNHIAGQGNISITESTPIFDSEATEKEINEQRPTSPKSPSRVYLESDLLPGISEQCQNTIQHCEGADLEPPHVCLSSSEEQSNTSSTCINETRGTIGASFDQSCHNTLLCKPESKDLARESTTNSQIQCSTESMPIVNGLTVSSGQFDQVEKQTNDTPLHGYKNEGFG